MSEVRVVRVGPEEIHERLHKLYDQWVNAGKEDEWHRLAKDYDLPDELADMYWFFDKTTKEMEYAQNCDMCAQGRLWGLWKSPNGNYWHSVDGYPQHRCKADRLRKLTDGKE